MTGLNKMFDRKQNNNISGIEKNWKSAWIHKVPDNIYDEGIHHVPMPLIKETIEVVWSWGFELSKIKNCISNLLWFNLS